MAAASRAPLARAQARQHPDRHRQFGNQLRRPQHERRGRRTDRAGRGSRSGRFSALCAGRRHRLPVHACAGAGRTAAASAFPARNPSRTGTTRQRCMISTCPAGSAAAEGATAMLLVLSGLIGVSRGAPCDDGPGGGQLGTHISAGSTSPTAGWPSWAIAGPLGYSPRWRWSNWWPTSCPRRRAGRCRNSLVREFSRGGLSGATLGAASDLLFGGAVAGVIGAIVGTYGGAAARTEPCRYVRTRSARRPLRGCRRGCRRVSRRMEPRMTNAFDAIIIGAGQAGPAACRPPRPAPA